MPETLWVAIDQGTHASRALAFDRAGRCLARGAAAVRLVRGEHGRVEQDPGELLSATRAALDALAAELGDAVTRVEAAGLATQRSSLLCWRRGDGVPLTPVLSWQDARAADLLASCLPPVAAVRAETGLYPNAHLGASKLAWCLRNDPALREGAETGEVAGGPLAAWLVRRLTGSDDDLVDAANAQRTLLWDRARGDWSPRLLAAFGIPAALPPRCGDSVLVDRTIALGAHRVPLTVLTGDQSAVPFAFGPVGTDDALVNLGTGAFVLRFLAPDERADGRLLDSVAWRAEGEALDVAEGTVNGAAAALSWWAEHRAGGRRPTLDDVLADPTLTPAPFLNTVGGLGSPDWVAAPAPRFLADGDARAELAGVAESILFLVARNLRRLGPVRRLLVAGGLARSDPLCARLAALTGLPVLRPAETEATARGVVDRLLRASGGLPTPPRRTFEPRSIPGLAAREAHWREALDEALAEAVGGGGSA